jgi:hypothetical protein
MLFRVWTHACRVLVLAGLCLAVAACGGSKGRATVKGQVTIGGKPLYWGSVVFHGADQKTGSSNIDKNGNYVMTDAPLGDVKVTVTVPSTTPGRGGPPGKKPSSKNPTGEMKDPNKPSEGSNEAFDINKVVPIPEKYSDPDKSGLTYKVEKGEHNFNIELKP